MSRQPIYHEQNDRYRVISVANGQWQAQQWVGRGLDSRTDHGGWKNIGRATTKDAAIADIYTAQPKA